MGADQIAEIRPQVVEVFDAAAAGESWCATFRITGYPDLWVEVTRESIRGPSRQSEPSEFLGNLPRALSQSLQVRDWSPNEFVTFSYDQTLSPRDVAQLVDALFALELGGADFDYSVDVTLTPQRA